MFITRQDMKDAVNNTFVRYGYKSDIIKRLCTQYNVMQLSYYDCSFLNDIVEKINSQMLNEVVFDEAMSIENFDNSIRRLLYVMGEWAELCFYQMLIIDTSNLFYVNICNECETHISVFFRTEDSNIAMAVDDQKVGIKIERTIKIEEEF